MSYTLQDLFIAGVKIRATERPAILASRPYKSYMRGIISAQECNEMLADLGFSLGVPVRYTRDEHDAITGFKRIRPAPKPSLRQTLGNLRVVKVHPKYKLSYCGETVRLGPKLYVGVVQVGRLLLITKRLT